MPQIKINGVEHIIDADPQMPLLWMIRGIIGLTGTKFGSGVGACGARTVLFDGEAVRPCLRNLADAQGHEVVTLSRASTPIAVIRCNVPGKRRMFRSAVIATRARSCRPSPCANRHRPWRSPVGIGKCPLW